MWLGKDGPAPARAATRKGSRAAVDAAAFVVPLSVALSLLLPAGLASAQTCSTTALPYTLSDGQTADASQVMADLSCAAAYGLAHASSAVGIGTTTPVYDLDIWGATANIRLLSTTATNPAYQFLSNTNGVLVGVESSTGGSLFTGSWAYAAVFGSQGSYPTQFASNNNIRMTINSSGNVGIGTVSPTALLFVNGTTVLTQGYTTTSDARLKTDVTPITGALAMVERLQGVRYRWLPADRRPVGKTLALPVDTPQVGFLAQAVEKVAPEAVARPKTADDVYTLDQSKLIPFLVEAIKEEANKIAALEAKIAKLEAAR